MNTTIAHGLPMALHELLTHHFLGFKSFFVSRQTACVCVSLSYRTPQLEGC